MFENKGRLKSVSRFITNFRIYVIINYTFTYKISPCNIFLTVRTKRQLYVFLDCFLHQPISRKEIRRGGIKVWIYNTYERVGESLMVSFDNSQSTVSQFNISLNFKVSQSASQSVSQSASQPVSQSVSQSVSQIVRQTVSQPVVSQSVSQSVSQTVRKSVSQSVRQSSSQTVSQLASRQSASQSVSKSVSQLIS